MNIFERILKMIFGSKQDRDLKHLYPAVKAVNLIEPALINLSIDQLKALAAEVKGYAQDDPMQAWEKTRAMAKDGIENLTDRSIEKTSNSLRDELKTKRNQYLEEYGDNPFGKVLTGPLRDDRIELLIAAHKKSLTDLKNASVSSDSILDNFETDYLSSDSDPLNPLLPLGFALVRECSKRILGLRHFDVQIIGGVCLHEGKISEMKTGEGKTLVATLAAALNAFAGKGVHIITVNDYLAGRDRDWMGILYHFLGLTTGVIENSTGQVERRDAYEADITFGTNSEFGFDYLRDNMSQTLEENAQRGHLFAVVDEVDSILIDEARTPLIISGPTDETTDIYRKMDDVAVMLKAGEDYELDEKHHTVNILDKGLEKATEILKQKGIITEGQLFTPNNMHLTHYLLQAIKARQLFKCDVEYVVKDGKIIIVDEFTGRLMPGRRWSEGMHQAVEAKERVKIEQETQTMATVTIQNYFRMYKKLSGMTGTADTEAPEFSKIYNLDVVVVPTHRPMVREDLDDLIYKTNKEKYNAIVEEIARIHETGAPVLVGTISIEVSELLSTMLKRMGVKHNVLNAKHHEHEAQIISEAGKMNSLTIATNMAGRGTDIVLGEGVPDVGGLHIIGTERHESRRIDNQLRGRAGRQGDPGSSQFFVSLEDDLMRLFGSDRIAGMLTRIGLEEGEPIFHPFITKAIARAQGKVEAMNFEIRKHLLEYDDVMNRQREIIYGERQQIIQEENLHKYVVDLIEDRVEDSVLSNSDEKKPLEDWDLESLDTRFEQIFDKKFVGGMAPETTQQELYDTVSKDMIRIYEEREAEHPEGMKAAERNVILFILDKFWKEHLYALDNLREGISLRSYGQKDPLVEFKRESFSMFDEMLDHMKNRMLQLLFRISDPGNIQMQQRRQQGSNLSYGRKFVTPPSSQSAPDEGPQDAPFMQGPPQGPSPGSDNIKSVGPSSAVGRNSPCPCGSGKKYKKCHGKN